MFKKRSVSILAQAVVETFVSSNEQGVARERLCFGSAMVLRRKLLDKREARIIQRLKSVAKLPVTTIAEVTERDKCSIYKVISDKPLFLKRGAKGKLQKKDIDRCVKVIRDMIKNAKARFEITLAMIKKRAKCHVDDKVLRKALASRKIKFRRPRSKPLLTLADRKARFKFAKLYRGKTVSWWLKMIHLHIDLKNFPVYTNHRARHLASMREVRGAYRTLGEGLDEAYVVLPKDLRFNPGATSCRIAAGVGGGRVRLWHEVGKKWTGKTAAEMYKGPLLSALRRGWPKRRSWKVLEDNDPTGFKSKKGEAAKAEAKICVFEIPKRSPDLNVCDYALWKQVSRTMRRQEKKFAETKKESRSRYIARLHRVAKGLSKTFIKKSIGDMVRRCRKLYAAKGGHFQEGGR